MRQQISVQGTFLHMRFCGLNAFNLGMRPISVSVYMTVFFVLKKCEHSAMKAQHVTFIRAVGKQKKNVSQNVKPSFVSAVSWFYPCLTVGLRKTWDQLEHYNTGVNINIRAAAIPRVPRSQKNHRAIFSASKTCLIKFQVCVSQGLLCETQCASVTSYARKAG